MVLRDSSFFGVRGYLAAHCVDENVDGFGERRPALNMVVADQAEESALGKNSGVVVK